MNNNNPVIINLFLRKRHAQPTNYVQTYGAGFACRAGFASRAGFPCRAVAELVLLAELVVLPELVSLAELVSLPELVSLESTGWYMEHSSSFMIPLICFP